ncbi:alpha/beta hydrolase [Oceanicoccus sagamiensis]|uniref:Serine aminopeptidase S33 domain-containing protein n=1 Tax=Oceanicoccus sagamiensis TaxID=716816 RepID=A0A1X9N7T3_9GAMM|nr:alpha/beta hydrolase [Oceanicoccus sagamiensis]ARN73174.1 hypothetical protein BST96_03075 [Oceanicoccus sagamiensis]
MIKTLLYRTAVNLLTSLSVLAVAILVIAYFFAKTLPALSYWHLDEVVKDYQLILDIKEINSFEQYLEQEEQLFTRLDRLIADKADPALVSWNRYQPGSALNAQGHAINWNKSFVLKPQAPKAAVIMVHGLSDSPYSVRALAESLYANNLLVVGLRMPGHGTIPAALRDTRWQDFRHSVTLASQWLHKTTGGDLPFYMLGYSNGAAIITDYSLLAMENKKLPVPDGLVMLSPALKVDAIAVFASAQRLLSDLPTLDKLAWLDVVPEYDPYKYNSFPVAAGEQIYKLTSSLQERLQQRKNNGGFNAFPPVLAFQSIVDATIPADAVISGLLDYLDAGDNQLILFDVNRSASIAPMLRTGHEQWLENLKSRPTTPFDIKVIRNQSENSLTVEELVRAHDQQQWQQQALTLAWPSGVYSLSHVALPFAANDPWYGAEERQQGGDILHLGSMEKRGERGVFGVSMDQLSRLRYNPFYDYLEDSIIGFIDSP